MLSILHSTSIMIYNSLIPMLVISTGIIYTIQSPCWQCEVNQHHMVQFRSPWVTMIGNRTSLAYDTCSRFSRCYNMEGRGSYSPTIRCPHVKISTVESYYLPRLQSPWVYVYRNSWVNSLYLAMSLSTHVTIVYIWHHILLWVFSPYVTNINRHHIQFSPHVTIST